MVEKGKHSESVNEPAAEAYQKIDKTMVLQFLEMAKDLSPSTIQEIVDKLELLMRKLQTKSRSSFSSFLLTGPQMSDSQFENFKEQRKSVNQWRENRSF